MGLDSAGYIFSDLLSFIFRINVIADIEEYKFVYTRRGWVCLLSCYLVYTCWRGVLKLCTFQ